MDILNWQRRESEMKQRVGDGTKKDNGIISNIIPFLSRKRHTNTPPYWSSHWRWKRRVGFPLLSSVNTHPPFPPSYPSPLTPNLPTPQARHARHGWVYSVTFLTHWRFCALFDLLSWLPQPMKRGNIIHQRPLLQETIYWPTTEARINKHSHLRTLNAIACSRDRYVNTYKKPSRLSEKHLRKEINESPAPSQKSGIKVPTVCEMPFNFL